MVIEKELIAYLGAVLDVPIYAERPANAEAPFVVLQKTGSSENNGLFTDTVAFQAYGKNLLDAAELNDALKSELDSMPEHSDIFMACYLNSDYNFTDTTTKEYRYQAVFNITY